MKGGVRMYETNNNHLSYVHPIRPVSKVTQAQLDLSEKYGHRRYKKHSKNKNKKHHTKDFLDLSYDAHENHFPENFNYSDLEKELDINSTRWSVDAVATHILISIELVYPLYKKKTSNKHENMALIKFYKLAKKAINQAYLKAHRILHTTPEKIIKLVEATVNKVLEKIDGWFESDSNLKEKINNIELSQKEDIDIGKKIEKTVSKLLINQALQIKSEIIHSHSANKIY